MKISENISLQKRNSFGFDVKAEYFISATTVDELREALEWQKSHNKSLQILGGGSNTVFTNNVEGLVLHIAIDGLVTDETDDGIVLTAGAGTNWHSLVETTISRQQFGLENLALIPGNAGAAPIQNIGAYGKEVCDNLISVEVLNRETGETFSLSKTDCQFDYRHSLFKTPSGKAYIVTSIQLHLSSADSPVVSYKALKDAMQGRRATAQEVFKQVCDLRRAKLPDPAVIGNAGSFFKNPVVTRQQVDEIKNKYPNLPVYPQANEHFKLPAAWLIDQAGWKGHRCGDVGVHKHQALVLVNYGGGNGQQIATLADDIQLDIKKRYNIDLEREPVFY